jgi:1,2-diacylglycerol 3-beta-galactosyltransferase
LITKAGPTTICEAFTRSLPMIISGYIPAQEDENAEYVVEHGAGVLAEEPALIVDTLRQWLSPDPTILQRLSQCSATLARPRAAIEAAEAVYQVAATHPTTIYTPHREPLLARLDRFLAN